MEKSKYELEKYNGMKTRYVCPNCKKRDKTFSRYIDLETGKHVADHVGRCNSEISCGYHYTPKQYYSDNNLTNPNNNFSKETYCKTKQPELVKAYTLISNEIFKQSLANYRKNNFVSYLLTLFGINITKNLIDKYKIGTSKYWIGSTVFWQVDVYGKVRSGKIMLYNPKTGKRVKVPFNHITWVHKVIGDSNFGLNQCLFGEHLLATSNKPVAVCESEKTAIIASVYYPEYTWLASGQLNGLNAKKCEVLAGRDVILFPDVSMIERGKLSTFQKWEAKANEMSNITDFKMSTFLEEIVTEEQRKQGIDIADYLVTLDYKEFLNNKLF